MLDTAEENIKVIVVGDGNVGKTCMLRRFVRGDFLEQYKKTIGAEFMEKDVFLRSTNTTVKLMLWDTAGQEVFNSLTQAYYRGAGAAVLAFSTVDRDSFEHVRGWKDKVESVCGPVTMVLCQTKMDLAHEAVTTNEEAEELAAELAIPLFRVSSKDDFNITQLFEFTAQQCVEAGQEKSGEGTPTKAAATTTGAGESNENKNPASHGAAAEAAAAPREGDVEPCAHNQDEMKNNELGNANSTGAAAKAAPIEKDAAVTAGPAATSAGGNGKANPKPVAPSVESKANANANGNKHHHQEEKKKKPATVNLKEADKTDKKKKKKKFKCMTV